MTIHAAEAESDAADAALAAAGRYTPKKGEAASTRDEQLATSDQSRQDERVHRERAENLKKAKPQKKARTGDGETYGIVKNGKVKAIFLVERRHRPTARYAG